MALADPTDIPRHGAALIESLQQHRSNILSKIATANGMTEREVLAVGASLKLIVDEARAYVADSRKTLEDFASASLADMLDRHSAFMTQFVEAMQQRVTAQGEAAKQATDQINRIVDLGRNIESVTMESKILALNANIQARRLGAAGESFLVIAQEMKHFSESVNNANNAVQELATGLLGVLPRIESLAKDMRITSDEFSRNIGNRVEEVASTNSEMKERVAASMASGETRLQQILSLSYEALSHLQFQDPVAQTLLSCDGDMKDCVRLAESWIAGGDAAMAEAEAAAHPAGGSESSLESGDIMLF